jgi:hypothetical protein
LRPELPVALLLLQTFGAGENAVVYEDIEGKRDIEFEQCDGDAIAHPCRLFGIKRNF